MRPKTTRRPATDIWSQPASRDGELSTREPPQQSCGADESDAGSAEVARKIAALVAPYQSVITDKTLNKIVD
jgi:hypothetical protein